MTDIERLIWTSAYSAAFVAEVNRISTGDAPHDSDADIAARAADTASQALKGLHDAHFLTKLSLSTRLEYDELTREDDE